MTSGMYDRDLGKNPANYAPLTPLSFLERAAYAYPERLSIIHGSERHTWKATYARARRLASALAKRGIGVGDTVAATMGSWRFIIIQSAILLLWIILNLTAWIDASGFSAEDQAYGLAAVQDALLRHGVRLIADRAKADAVILPRAGMLSTYETNTLIGIPSLPVPVAPGVMIPPLSFYSQNVAKGSAKFAASVYDPKSGRLIVSTDPTYGFSRIDNGVFLFLFTWHKNDMGVDFGDNPPKVQSRK